jgi:CubicO group peptidase (beta-lactamase class C family)
MTDSRNAAEELGFSAERLARLDDFYADAVEGGAATGVVTLVARHGRIAHLSAVGWTDLERRRPMRTDTLFRQYSMTKPIAATALMILYEEGLFQLDEPLAAYLPEFAGIRVLRHPDADLDDTVPAERPPTIHDVLRHTAGFTHCADADPFDRRARVVLEADSLAEAMTRLAELPLRYQPGTRWVYSVGPDVQARLVEVLSGERYEDFLAERLFGPLGMVDSGYAVTPDRADRLATLVELDGGGVLRRSVDITERAAESVLYEPWVADNPTAEHPRINGSYGLVSTAEDYARFAQMLLDGGESAGTRVLSPHTVRFMTRDHSGDFDIELPWRGVGFGLGFATIEDAAALGVIGTDGTFFFQGMAGTVFWVDPAEQLVAVAMIQSFGHSMRVAPWYSLRNLVYGAMTR